MKLTPYIILSKSCLNEGFLHRIVFSANEPVLQGDDLCFLTNEDVECIHSYPYARIKHLVYQGRVSKCILDINGVYTYILNHPMIGAKGDD